MPPHSISGNHLFYTLFYPFQVVELYKYRKKYERVAQLPPEPTRQNANAESPSKDERRTPLSERKRWMFAINK